MHVVIRCAFIKFVHNSCAVPICPSTCSVCPLLICHAIASDVVICNSGSLEGARRSLYFYVSHKCWLRIMTELINRFHTIVSDVMMCI